MVESITQGLNYINEQQEKVNNELTKLFEKLNKINLKPTAGPPPSPSPGPTPSPPSGPPLSPSPNYSSTNKKLLRNFKKTVEIIKKRKLVRIPKKNIMLFVGPRGGLYYINNYFNLISFNKN